MINFCFVLRMSSQGWYPLEKKILILRRIRPVNRFLFGEPTGEFSIPRRREELLKVKDYCLEIGAPNIKSGEDVMTKYNRWKQALAEKVKRGKKTGSAGNQDFNEAERLIHAIINENPCTRNSKAKVRLPYPRK